MGTRSDEDDEMNRAVLAGVAALAMISGSGESRTRSGNRPVTEIHFDAVRGGMPFFPATVNAIGPFQFLLDTGGSGGHVDREIAKRLGLRLERGTASVSGSANLEVGIIPEATLAIGAARHRGQLLVSPLAPIEPILGRPLEGIIGSDFLQRCVLELNYDARVLRLYPSADFHYTGRGQPLRLSFAQGIPFVRLAVSLANGKAINGDFLIDTAGGRMAIHVHKQIAERDGLLGGAPSREEKGHGIGGETSRTVARGVAVAIGSYRVSGPIVAITEDTAGLRTNPQSLGLVGMEVLGRFNLTFDYSRSIVYVEPNRTFDAPLVYDSTGLDLRATRPSFSPAYVHSVRDRSPAKDAGIEAGDVLVRIDDRPASGLTLDESREQLKTPGRTHRLSVSRQGKIVSVTLRTRDLLG
jgi:predicted aspartyl protease